jgi:hypothetical protein
LPSGVGRCQWPGGCPEFGGVILSFFGMFTTAAPLQRAAWRNEIPSRAALRYAGPAPAVIHYTSPGPMLPRDPPCRGGPARQAT